MNKLIQSELEDSKIRAKNLAESTMSQLNFQEIYMNPIKEQSFSQQSNDDQIVLFNNQQNQNAQNDGPTSSIKINILSEMSSIPGSNPGSNLKTKSNVKQLLPSQPIKAVPDEILFDGVSIQDISQDFKVEKVLLKNLLSIPVELNVETSQSKSDVNILQLNLFDIDVTPQVLQLKSLESGYIRVQIKPKKGSNYLSKLPTKLKEVIFLKNENFEQKLNVTIILKNKNEESENGSNYTYGGNNESIMSSSRYSLMSRSKQGKVGNAIQKMRSLSKEIKDQKKRGNSLQTSQNDDEHDSMITSHIGKQKIGPNLPLAKSAISNNDKQSAKQIRGQELADYQEQEETFRKNDKKERRIILSAKQNNMTASFNQEELKILEQQYNQINGITDHTIISKNENPFKGLTIAKNTIMKYKQEQKQKKKAFQISDLEKSESELRNDLDESGIEEAEDLQRSNMNDVELNLTDMTHSNNAIEARDQNDQSLRLNQLENSLPLQNHSNFSYSKTNKSFNVAAITNKTEGKFEMTPSYSQQQNSEASNLDQAQKILSLQNELKTCQRILQQQQSLLQNEKQKRELIQDELTTSKLQSNEQSIMNKIQELLKDQDPNIQQIMNVSMMQERQNQAKKDQQVLQILKQKDAEISELSNALEQAINKINLYEQNELLLVQQNRQLKIEIDQYKMISNKFEESEIDNDVDLKFKQHAYEIQEMQSNYDQLHLKNLQLQNCMQDLNQKLNYKDQIYQKLEQENDSLKEKLEILDYQLQEHNSNMRSDIKSEENRILVREIERLEKENVDIIQRTQEALNEYKEQNILLQEKLAQSYQDIQRLAVSNNEQMFSQQIKTNQFQQSDIEMQLMDKLIESMSIQIINEENRKSSSSIQMEDMYLKPIVHHDQKLNIVENSSKNSMQQISNLNHSSQQSHAKIQSETTILQKQDQEIMISQLKETIQQLQDQLNERKNKLELKVEKDGMSYEDLQKHCDYLSKQNQKLMIKVLDIKDVDEFNQIQINMKETADLKVFNPYKTNLEAQNAENVKSLEQYQPMLIDKIINENFELKQDLAILKSKHLCRDQEYQQIQQLKNQLQQREITVKQLKDQLNQCEKSFREEIDKRQFDQLAQNEKIAQLNKQYGSNYNENQVFTNLETSNLEKELKLILSKIHIQYESVIQLIKNNKNGNEQVEFELNEIVSKLHNSVQIASKTIQKQKKDIYNLQMKIVQQDAFQNAAVINRILANRHYFFITYIKILQEVIHDKNQNFCKQTDETILYYEKIISQFEQDSQTSIANNEKLVQYERVISQWQLKAQEFQRIINLKDVEISNLKKSYQKRAEIEYDERQNLRDEKIKSYVDSQVMKYLIQNNQDQEDVFPGEARNTQTEKDTIELTRQFCNLQIQVDQLSNQNQLLQFEKDNYLKKQQEHEQQLKKLTEELSKAEEAKFEAQLKEQANRTVISQAENEIVKFLKQEMQRINLNLQQKQLEIDDLKVDQMNQQFQNCFWKFEDALQIIEKDLKTGKAILGSEFLGQTHDYTNFGNPLINQELRSQVENFQQQIIDLRTQQIFEIEEIKTNCEIELMEEKKKLQKQQDQINKYQKKHQKPNENSDFEIKYYETYEQNQNLQAQIESLRTELAIIEKKQEEDKFKQFNLQDEIRAYKETIQELKSELCQPNQQQRDTKYQQIEDQINQMQMQRDLSILDQQHIQVDAQKRKNSKDNKPYKKGGLIKVQNKRDFSNQREDMNQISRFTNEAFNLNPLATNRSFSTITISNSQNQEYANQNQDQFSFNPPAIIQQLIQAKIKEKQLLIQFEKCAQKELEARQEIKKIFVENQQKKVGDSNIERELQDEKLKNYDLEKKLRELELKALMDDERTENNLENNKDLNAEIPNKDYELMANTIIHLINIQFKSDIEKKRRLREDDINKVFEQDQVYKNIIVQLSRKVIQMQHHDSQKVMINQYMPTNPKDQKIWYLELLESQLQSAENMISKLFDFIKRLQIDIQGSLTSAAQIKATSLDLASNTKNTSEEIKLLGFIAQLIRSDIDNGNHQDKSIQLKNPFQENTLGNQNIMMNQNQKSFFELHSQLQITQQIKQQMEAELKELKETLVKTKQTQEQQLKDLTENNKNLQQKVQKLQKEVNEKIDENKNQQKELKKLRKTVNCEEDEQKSSAVKQNQSLTSKNILKLQKDMQEWKKINEENLKIKENKLNELKDKYQKQEKEFTKLKAENQMLRKNQKEWLQSSTKQLEDQKQELQKRLNNIEQDKENQLQQMRIEKLKLTQKIEELEESLEDRKGEGLLSKFLKPTDDHNETTIDLPQQKEASGDYVDLIQKHKKIQKKYTKKSELLKQKDQELINMQEEINKLEQICRMKNEEKDLLNSQMKQQEIESKTLEQTIRQLEYEKKMYQMQRDCLNQNKDQIQTLVHQQLDDLRSSFAQLQIEKNALDIEMDKCKNQENKWKQLVERNKKEMETFNIKFQDQINLTNKKIIDLEAKEAKYQVQVKLLNNENTQIKNDNQIIIQKLQEQENEICEKDQSLKLLQAKFDEKQSRMSQIQTQNEKTEEMFIKVQQQLEYEIIDKNRKYEQFSQKLIEIIESRNSLSELYESQLDIMKQKLSNCFLQIQEHKDGKQSKDHKEKIDKEIDLIYQISQRDSTIKSMKKETLNLKSQIQKFKQQNNELKSELKEQIIKFETQIPVQQKKNKKVVYNLEKKDIENTNIQNQEVLSKVDEDILEKIRNLNILSEQILDLQSQISQSECSLKIAVTEYQYKNEIIEDLRDQIEQIGQREIRDEQLSKIVQTQTDQIKQLRQETKSNEQELSIIKSTWIDPKK